VESLYLKKLSLNHNTSVNNISYYFFCVFLEKKYCKIYLLFLMGIISISVVADDIDRVRFKESQWDSRVLRILIEGPLRLDANLGFEISPPPTNNSDITRHELEILESYQRQGRTPEQIAKIKREAASGAFVDMFLGDPIVPKKLANMARNILSMADRECQYFVVNYKKRFARPRPSQLAPSLTLVVPNPGHAAYPSGHATQSMLMASIISLIDSDNKLRYLSYARAIAKRREIAGVHYPSDSLSGQQLAMGILNALMVNTDFNKELDRVTLLYSQSDE
jgi:hypothetical protein